MPNLWTPGLSPFGDAAIRRWEIQQWTQDSPDWHNDSLIRMGLAHHKPGDVLEENQAILVREMAWRRQGDGGPFR